MAQFIVPYTPNLVPQGEDVLELERFLADELRRISISIRGSSVQSAYGGLLVDTPQTDTASILPHKITDWNNFTPEAPNRITTIAPDFDDLTVLEDGVYMAMCTISVAIRSGVRYSCTLAVNDVPSSIVSAVDASNQTDVITLAFSGMLDITPGDVLSVAVAANSDNEQFDIQSAIFMMFRISEIHQLRT